MNDTNSFHLEISNKYIKKQYSVLFINLSIAELKNKRERKINARTNERPIVRPSFLGLYSNLHTYNLLLLAHIKYHSLKSSKKQHTSLKS